MSGTTPRGSIKSSCLALLSLDAGAFVGSAYRLLLGRPADPQAYGDLLRQMSRGLTKRAVLASILGGAEARLHLGDTAETLAADFSANPPLLAWEAARKLLFRVWRQNPVLPVSLPALRVADQPIIDSLPPATPVRREQGAPSRAFFTIATANYLTRVRVLMRSLQQAHPEAARFTVLLASEVDDKTSLVGGAEDTDLFETIDARTIGASSFADMALRYGLVEMCTALKPFAIQHLWNVRDMDTIVYLDPDVLVLQPLRAVQSLLQEGHPMVLTPHITQPLRGPGEPNNHSFLQSGMFNLGFIAVRRCAAAADFVSWWSEQLQTGAIVDFANNLFTDQRWCDFAPCLVENLAILRDPAYNIAYWNLAHRKPRLAPNGDWTVGDKAIVFMHYSGFDPRQPDRVSRFQDRLDTDTTLAVRPLLHIYAQSVKAEEAAASERTCVPNYVPPLPDLLRRYYRHHHPTPVTVTLSKTLAGLLESAWAASDGVPPLLRFLHASRSDLLGSFNLAEPADRQRFLAWFVHAGIHEDGLADMTRGAELDS